jgi:hypothetical protein
VLWNQPVSTDRKVMADRQYITIKKEKPFTLIDVAIPTDRNVLQR